MFLFSFNWTHAIRERPNFKQVNPLKNVENNTLKENYNQPLILRPFYSYILEGLIVQATQKVDMLFTQTVCL